MKRILKISLFIILIVGTIFVLVSANHNAIKQPVSAPEINLEVQDGISLLTEQELMNELKVKQLYREGLMKSELKVDEIEDYIRGMNEVLTADVYMELDSRWSIDVKTRRPIARVVANLIDDFYVDNDFKLMRLSPYARPKVLVFTGMERLIKKTAQYDEIINNDSLKTIFKLDQIYRISNYVCNDTFYNAQIVQVHYTEEDDFVLIPRVGEQKIIFGEALSDQMVEDKFKKLTTFYNEVIPFEGWDKYESINLKFKDQIVAKKK